MFDVVVKEDALVLNKSFIESIVETSKEADEIRKVGESYHLLKDGKFLKSCRDYHFSFEVSE